MNLRNIFSIISLMFFLTAIINFTYQEAQNVTVEKTLNISLSKGVVTQKEQNHQTHFSEAKQNQKTNVIHGELIKQDRYIDHLWNSFTNKCKNLWADIYTA